MIDRLLDERVQLLSAASSGGHCALRGRGTRTGASCAYSETSDRESRRRSWSRCARSRPASPATGRRWGTVPPDVGANNTDTAEVVMREQRVSPDAGKGKRPKPRFTG